MDKVKLVVPDSSREQQAQEYIRELRETATPINGAGGLDRYENYFEWLGKLADDLHADVDADRVPSHTFFAVRETDGYLVGMTNIRHCLNEFLFREGGHIGYGVRPTEHRKGYATQMLRQTLAFCHDLGLERVLVTCDKHNIASAKTILRCGGVLENEITDGTIADVIQRYWIDTDHMPRQ
ncbi:MAG: GNAT family N-acetyltransferase [Anaerofustis sp.]